MTRVLLIRPDKAGDALKSLSAIRSAAQLPDTQVSLWVSEYNASVFEFEPNLDIHTLPPAWAQAPDEALELWATQTDPTDVCILLPQDPTEAMERLVRVARASRKCMARGAGAAAGRDESETCARFVSRHLGVADFPVDRHAVPILSESDLREAEMDLENIPGKKIGMCPLAGGQDRSHTLQRWRHFIAKVSAKDQTLFLFGSPADRSRLEFLRGDRAHIRICTPSSFRALGAYLRKMDEVVGVDSGPLHYARALNVPSLTLMSGGDRLRWFPEMGARHSVLRRGLFDRFPFVWEMSLALGKWRKALH